MVIGWIKLNEIDESSIRIISSYTNDTIQHTYGERLDLSGVAVEYQNKKHDLKKDDVTMDMVKGYDPERIGRQPIQIEFKNVTKDMYVFTVPADIDAPLLEASGKSLVWSSVKHSSSYNLFFGTNENSLTFFENVSSCQYDLTNFSNYGYCYFKVQAIKESEKFNDSNDSNVISVYNLEKATNITYSDGTIKWDAVTGASSYTVVVNGERHQGITSPNYSINLDEGVNSVYVEAYSDIANSLYSVSNLYAFELLNQVSNISYKNGYVFWNNVVSASSYDVYLNDEFYLNTHDPKIPVTAFAQGVYKIGVVARSENASYVNSNKVEFNCLINFDLNVNKGVLSFNNLPGDYYYRLVTDRHASDTLLKSNAVDCNSLELTPGDHTFQIMVDCNVKLDLNFSSEVKMTKLTKPTLAINDGVINASSGEGTIVYYLDGREFNGNLNEVSAPGSHRISGKRIATSDYEIDSELSETLRIEKYNKPSLSISNKKIVVDDSTKRVQFYLNGAEFDGDLLSIKRSGTYSITARYLAEDAYSLSSELSEPITVKKLEKPTITITHNALSCDDPEKQIVYYLNGNEFDGDLKEITKPGAYNIVAKYLGQNDYELDSEESNSISLHKLDSPSLSIINGRVMCDDPGKNVKFYLNGEEFDGNLGSLGAGTYVITAKYFSSSGEELDSEMSSVEITRLASPVISLENETLTCDQSDKRIQWYLNDTEFDGDLSALDASEYTITAKYLGGNSTTLDSLLSNAIEVTKLPAPTIELTEDKTLVCTSNDIDLQYYLDGEVFDGAYSSIPTGSHVIKATNKGDGSTSVSSNFSNELKVFNSGVTIEISPSTNNRLSCRLATNEETILYDMKIDFYTEDRLIDTLEYKDRDACIQLISYSRDGTAATKIVIQVTVKGPESNDIIKMEYSI